METILGERFTAIEEILGELLACRSLKEVEEKCTHVVYDDDPYLERFYFEDKLILEVRFNVEERRWDFYSAYADYRKRNKRTDERTMAPLIYPGRHET